MDARLLSIYEKLTSILPDPWDELVLSAVGTFLLALGIVAGLAAFAALPLAVKVGAVGVGVRFLYEAKVDPNGFKLRDVLLALVGLTVLCIGLYLLHR